MKRLLLALLLLSLLSPLWGDDLFDDPAADLERERAEAVFAGLSARPHMKAAFGQTKTVTRLKRSFKSSGTLIFSDGRGIAWLFEKPFKSRMVISDTGISQSGSGGETSVMEAEGNELFTRFSRTVQSLFTGDMDSIDRDYTLYYDDDGRGGWRIGLIPRDSLLLQAVRAFEMAGRDGIESFLIHEGGGDLVLYEFSDHEYPDSLSTEDAFVFP